MLLCNLIACLTSRAWQPCAQADKVTQTNTSVANLKQLGNAIVTAKYKTSLSEYVFPTPDEIHSREKFVDDQWQVR